MKKDRVKRSKVQTYSIFGQIEAVAAEIMIKKGSATKIEAKDIPQIVSVNEKGQPAKFAVIISDIHLSEFEKLIADLRA